MKLLIEPPFDIEPDRGRRPKPEVVAVVVLDPYKKRFKAEGILGRRLVRFLSPFVTELANCAFGFGLGHTDVSLSGLFTTLRSASSLRSPPEFGRASQFRARR